MASDYACINELTPVGSLEDAPGDLRDTLDLLTEECAEIIQAASKANRFGLTDAYSGETNRQKLETEIGDLLCLVSILVDNRVLDPKEIERAMVNKHVKLLKWAPTVAKYWKGL